MSISAFLAGFHSLRCYSFAPYPPQAMVDADQSLWEYWWIVQTFKKGRTNYRLPAGQWVDAGHYVATSVDATGPAYIAGRTLVPVPGHDVTPQRPSPLAWPGLRMANALQTQFGNSVAIAIRRTAMIQQSSRATSLAERATVEEHVESLSVDLTGVGDSILLVDDTLTSGTTCMGAFQALRRAGYRGDIRAFTIGHVMGAPSDTTFHLRTTIHWNEDGGGHANRS